MKRVCRIIITSALTLFLCALALTAYAAEDNRININMGVGETVDAFDLIERGDGEYTFESSDADGVGVAENGLIEARAVGEYIVTVTHIYTINSEVGELPTEQTEIYELSVSVQKAPKGLALNAHKIALQKDKPYNLEATLLDGASYHIDYVSSNPEIAEVDGGVVTPHTSGSVAITATAYNGVSDKCEITFTDGEPKIVITSQNTKIQKGASIHQILYKFSGGISGSVSFSSSDKSVFKVDKNGYVKGKSTGKATVKICTEYENVYAKQKLTVVDIALSLNRNSVQIALDQPNVTRVKYGKSAQGRCLEAFEIINAKTGKYKKTLFIDFAVHGFEDDYARDGKKLVEEANKLIEYFAFHSDKLGNYRLVVVPCANPDGTIAGKNNKRACASAFGRCTAKHVDMNRDFIRFKAVESRKLRDYIKKCKPDVYLNMHGWLNETIGNKKLCKVINKQLGFTKIVNSYGTPSGYIIGWVNKTLHIPAALVEYKSPDSIDTTKDIKMIRAIIKKYK